jgi:predicted Fe-S protein YdhL (DUF1289 family)
MPAEAWGSHENVRKWLRMPEGERREILEKYDLIYSEKEEVELVLRNAHTEEPFFWG